MWQLLADENFNGDIVRGLLRRQPDVHITRVQDTLLAGAADADVLSWAAENHYILLTHDRATMVRYARQRLARQQSLPGLFVLSGRLPVGDAIHELQLILACTDPSEWNGRVVFVPL